VIVVAVFVAFLPAAVFIPVTGAVSAPIIAVGGGVVINCRFGDHGTLAVVVVVMVVIVFMIRAPAE